MSAGPLRLGVSGVGLIGASIGLRATALGMHVTGFDPAQGALAVARNRGAIAETVPTFADLALASDVLILAGPLEATLAHIVELAAIPTRAVAIFDVASVKMPVARAARGLAAFVPTHPIAGSERSGPAAATAGLFEGKTWTVDPRAKPEPLAQTRRLIEAFGACVLEIESDEHDRTIALTSHLPQLLAVALAAQLGERLNDPATREMCGTGMRSMIRLGASSWSMWRAVLAANSVPVAQEVRRLAAILSDAADLLETQRVDELAARFTTAATAVARLGDNASGQKGEF